MVRFAPTEQEDVPSHSLTWQSDSWSGLARKMHCVRGTPMETTSRTSAASRASSIWGRDAIAILIVALVFTAAKIYCAVTTYGTFDIELYYRYGRVVHYAGFAEALKVQAFNLPPLAAEYTATLAAAMEGREEWFPFGLKIPGILSYLGTVVAMIWLRSRIPQIPVWVLILFAASPVSFMVDGYHGNIDSVMVFPLVLAGCMCALKRPNWVLCSLFLALACHVKVAALLMAPVFWFYWMHRGRGMHFFASTAAAVIGGWLPGLLANPVAFATNVVGYGSVWGSWGFTQLLQLTGHELFERGHWTKLSSSQIVVSQILKVFIVSIVIVAGWRNRKGGIVELFSTLAFAWITFFTFAPGLGFQYMVWFAPFLLVWNARWYAALAASTSLVLFLYYHVTSGSSIPWYQASIPGFGPYGSVRIALWLVFMACMIASVREGILRPKESQDDAAVDGAARSIIDPKPQPLASY
jgi:hypothetical protein